MPKIKAKKPPTSEQPIYIPKVGEQVRIVRSSIHWAPGKIGIVQGDSTGQAGYAVTVLYKDDFMGETKPEEHTIWCEVVEPCSGAGNLKTRAKEREYDKVIVPGSGRWIGIDKHGVIYVMRRAPDGELKCLVSINGADQLFSPLLEVLKDIAARMALLENLSGQNPART